MIFGNFDVFLGIFNDSFPKQIIKEGQEVMDNKEPSSRLVGLS